MAGLEVQTRSNFTGIEYHHDVKSAYEFWLQDKYIWKISFDEDDISKRFRVKTKANRWNLHSERRIKDICPAYETAGINDVFWIDQAMFPDDYDNWDLRKKRRDEDYDNQYMAACIREAHTDSEFKFLYCGYMEQTATN